MRFRVTSSFAFSISLLGLISVAGCSLDRRGLADDGLGGVAGAGGKGAGGATASGGAGGVPIQVTGGGGSPSVGSDAGDDAHQIADAGGRGGEGGQGQGGMGAGGMGTGGMGAGGMGTGGMGTGGMGAGGIGGKGGAGGLMIADAGPPPPPDSGMSMDAGIPPRACGGGQGACPIAMFCERDVGACGGAGVCVPIPLICPNVVARVCGCNGTTYLNDCLRIRAGVDKSSDGPC
jgi:hypothetical protein